MYSTLWLRAIQLHVIKSIHTQLKASNPSNTVNVNPILFSTPHGPETMAYTVHGQCDRLKSIPTSELFAVLWIITLVYVSKVMAWNRTWSKYLI